MKRTIVVISVMTVIALAALLRLTYVSHSAAAAKTKLRPVSTVNIVAGPGRIEPVSEDIQLGAEVSGKLRSVSVEEGDFVHKGEVLAVIENADYRAQLGSAEAEVRSKQAALRKVRNGAEPAQRSEALAKVRAAAAVMANAEAELQRRQALFDAGLISREELEHYAREYNVAREEHQQNVEHHALLNGDTREEDVAVAEADLALSEAHLADARAKYDKTVITSPIDGVVLRKHHRAGENVSNSATAPDPVLTIGDTRVLHVRVDIDEADINKVYLGQKAYVTADAFGAQKFPGRIVRIGELLGPKTVRTDEPTERVDRKFLETIVELEPGAHLPMGLRVDTFILTDNAQAALVR